MLSLLLLIGFPAFCLQANILLVPLEHGSHVNFFSHVGEILSTKGGHNVYILGCPRQMDLLKKFKHINTRFILPESICEKNPIIKWMQDANNLDSSNPVLYIIKRRLFFKEVASFLGDMSEHFLKEIFPKSNITFDLIIADGIDFVRTSYVIPIYLNTPFITLHGRPDPWTCRVPAIPTHEGAMLGAILDKDSTILDRMISTFAYIAFNYVANPVIIDHNSVNRILPNDKNSINNILENSKIVLVNMDPIVADFHRMETTNYKHVGSFGVQEGKALKAPFLEFVSEAESGFILVTFGSGIGTIPEYLLEKILNVGERIPQRMLIRHKGQHSNRTYPENVLVREWLPQNDLLAHPKCKAFIAHGGANGQMESIYHGVPQIIIHFFGDQLYNGRRAQRRKIGRMLDRYTFTEDDLFCGN